MSRSVTASAVYNLKAGTDKYFWATFTQFDLTSSWTGLCSCHTGTNSAGFNSTHCFFLTNETSVGFSLVSIVNLTNVALVCLVSSKLASSSGISPWPKLIQAIFLTSNFSPLTSWLLGTYFFFKKDFIIVHHSSTSTQWLLTFCKWLFRRVIAHSWGVSIFSWVLKCCCMHPNRLSHIEKECPSNRNFRSTRRNVPFFTRLSR